MERLGIVLDPVRAGTVATLVAAALCTATLSLVTSPALAQDRLAQDRFAQDRELSPQGKARDANGNGVIDPDEAGGPLKANFAEIDCDGSDSLDGAEIRRFFEGEGCPAGQAAEGGKDGAETPSASGGDPPRPVRVDEVVVEPQSQTYPVIGRLVPRRAGDVAARINGAIMAINVDVGDRVETGDIIAELANDRLVAEREKFAAAVRTRKAMVQTAQAELAKTQGELERIVGLRKSSAFSRARFDDIQRDVEARRASLAERRSQLNEAEAEFERASIDVHNSRIRAPYSGIVSERHTEVGAYVGVGARVVSLINDEDLEIEAEVPTDRVAGLQPGATVRFSLDDGTQHRATVRAVIPWENLRTRTRPVRFAPTFGDTEKALAANQSLTVHVPVGRVREIVTVHKDAIVHRGDDRIVYVVRRGRAFPRKVTTGNAIGARYAVTRGLKAGEIVVTHGNETLPPASPVEVVKDGAESDRRNLGQ